SSSFSFFFFSVLTAFLLNLIVELSRSVSLRAAAIRLSISRAEDWKAILSLSIWSLTDPMIMSIEGIRVERKRVQTNEQVSERAIVTL
ncbi:hypothetical protein PMAYCL1PPCAC_26629, partial [Pristionchus mayeri]